MAILAGSVLTEIKGLLNDPTGSIYPDIAVIPILNKSYRELQVKLGALGIGVTRELLASIPVPAGVKSLDDGSGLPTDFVLPVELAERDSGSSDDYSPMTESEWEPARAQQNTLGVWAYREESIKFVGALTDRELLLRYFKNLPPITDVNTPVLITSSQTWLAQRTASLAALLIGANPTRAQTLLTDLYSPNGPWEDLKATKVKRLQNLPVRRRRTRWRVY